MKQINIGIFGLGSVGQGVVKLLEKNQQILQQKTGVCLKIVKAVVKHPEKTRDIVPDFPIHKDPDFILNDPTIDIVIELTGGIDFPLHILQNSLAKKKAWVSANKAMIAQAGKTVWPLFQKNPHLIGFEASVGGVTPIIQTIQESFASDRIVSIATIINGTTNFILSAMSNQNLEFDKALKLAQEKGFAELDPSFDIDGVDSAHKICILGHLAFHHAFDFEQIDIQGIRKINFTDLHYTKKLGYRIKLLGIAKILPQGYGLYVYPALVHKNSLLATVEDSFNSTVIRGEFLGQSLIYGLGAGAEPTAVAVVSDVLKIVRGHYFDTAPTTSFLAETYRFEPSPIVAKQDIESAHYLRFRVPDKVGILSKLAFTFSEQQLSIHQMFQQQVDQKATKHPAENIVDIVIITHRAKHQDVKNTIEKITQLGITIDPTECFIIEDNL